MADSHVNDKTVHSGFAAAPSPFNAAEIFAQAAPSVVRIDNYLFGLLHTSSGSGFFVSSDQPHSCEIASNYHMTSGAKSAWVTTHDGQTYQAKLEKIDPQHDLIVYKLQGVQDPERTCRELPLRTTEPVIGEPSLAIGAGGKEASAQNPQFESETVIGMRASDEFYGKLNSSAARITKVPGEVNRLMVQTTGIGKHGYSGGPRLDGSGKVMAVSEMSDKEMNLGESAQFLQALLEDIKNNK